ncbi:MAG: cytidine deaminase [Bacteroidales bacterium]
MNEFIISTKIAVYSYNELSVSDKNLVNTAKSAALRSYSPYSKFSVGAAVELDNGEIISGSNQENIAYPSGLCAERTTIFYAHSAHPDATMQTIAIAAHTDGAYTANPITPCGACRQAISEYERLANHNIRIILYGEDKIYILESIAALLPLTF